MPDLIISDILMPKMDGFALCRHWKADAVLKNIPFIFYTATYTDTKDETFALGLGADMFIVKPTDPDTFAAKIKGVLGETRKPGHSKRHTSRRCRSRSCWRNITRR